MDLDITMESESASDVTPFGCYKRLSGCNRVLPGRGSNVAEGRQGLDSELCPQLAAG